LQKNKLKVIGGEWRSRSLPVQNVADLRPTPARVRETLFNWLQYDVPGSRCLDLYAGSGALGVEAASRGAKVVVQVEYNALVCRQLKENTVKLNARQIKIVQQDVFRFLAGSVEQCFNLVFLDPPFGQQMAQQTCHWLEDKGWLESSARIYVEVEKGLHLDVMPKNWQQLKKKTAGEVDYYLFERL